MVPRMDGSQTSKALSSSLPPPFSRATVLGAGRWGSAISIWLATRGLTITLWCFEKEVREAIAGARENPYLPGYSFPENVEPTTDLKAVSEERELLILAVPCQFLRPTLERLGRCSSPVLGVNKGIERDTGLTVPEIVRQVLGPVPYAHLGGPCFPEGLLNPETPVAETVASEDPDLAKRVQRLFAWRNFRPYRSADVRGVAVLGALKNVYAIGAGIASALGLGEESLAVLVTRALAELRRLALAMGIPETTVYGLSGVGDLVLTCYSPRHSRNHNFGAALGRGESVEEVLKSMGNKVAEGYYTAAAVRKLAERYEVEMPLAEAIHRILYQGVQVKQVLSELMERPLKTEH